VGLQLVHHGAPAVTLEREDPERWMGPEQRGELIDALRRADAGDQDFGIVQAEGIHESLGAIGRIDDIKVWCFRQDSLDDVSEHPGKSCHHHADLFHPGSSGDVRKVGFGAEDANAPSGLQEIQETV
jgi:hypothetical protein